MFGLLCGVCVGFALLTSFGMCPSSYRGSPLARCARHLVPRCVSLVSLATRDMVLLWTGLVPRLCGCFVVAGENLRVACDGFAFVVVALLSARRCDILTAKGNRACPMPCCQRTGASLCMMRTNCGVWAARRLVVFRWSACGARHRAVCQRWRWHLCLSHDCRCRRQCNGVRA